MSEKNDFIQLPPIKKDTSSDVVAFIWEYMKIPESSREKVKDLIKDEMCIRDRVNGAVFHFLRRLFLRLGQPFPDGGLFLTAHFPAGKLLKCRCDGVCVPAFEKDQVTGCLLYTSRCV